MEASASRLDAAAVGDLVLLEPLTEESLLRALQERFRNGDIYTYIGAVVISVNPYCLLPLYTAEAVQQYRGCSSFALKPHVYALADAAYRSLRDCDRDQCVLITGESGSGKTEASKLVMSYVAAVCGKGAEVTKVTEQLLQSNPVLEAFGNAKTIRNDNSSRFGKYMDVEFDFKGEPLGGVISSYLLEKSRVVRHARGERNFHVFYQLLAGAPAELLQRLRLRRDCDHYSYLGSESCSLPGVDDAAGFRAVQDAMRVIGFSPEEVAALLEVTAVVLKLGNVQLSSRFQAGGVEACSVAEPRELEEICELAGLEPGALERALCARTVRARHEAVLTSLSVSQGYYVRDALAKNIYSRLFDWLVTRINGGIRAKAGQQSKVMGVLDIYGFEIFQDNGFEQFVINYCNEKLQQVFIQLTLKEEQEEYVREGIPWSPVEFFDNNIICDLIENGSRGILAMLDEECLRPGAVSAATLLGKLDQTCGGHGRYESRQTQSARRLHDASLAPHCFRLHHYAGKVTYDVSGFVEKNTDLLFRDLSQAMWAARQPLLRGLFPEGEPGKASLRLPPTAASQVKASVGALMRNLYSKNPNYIRCIKPNESKAPMVLAPELVLAQIRYLGLLENVRVRRAGYAFRQLYGPFLERYKMLCPRTWPHWAGDERAGVETLLSEVPLPAEELAFGHSKVFIRSPRTLFALERRRQERVAQLATLIQAAVRGWRCRTRFQRQRQSQILIAAWFRGHAQRQRYQQMRRSALLLQAYARGWKSRRLLRQLKSRRRRHCAASTIAAYWRGHQVRRQYRKYFRSGAGARLANFIHRRLVQRFLLGLRDNLPPLAVADRSWPPAPYGFLGSANRELQDIFYRWKCKKYREQLTPERRALLQAKLCASELFKDKKSLYPKSLPQPFRGEYLGLQQNPKYQKLQAVAKDKLVMAEAVRKVNRGSGKTVPRLLLLTTEHLVLADPKGAQPKTVLSLGDIRSVSVTRFSDGFLALHLKESAGAKGDVLLVSEHLIELVTRLHQALREATAQELPLRIADRFSTRFPKGDVAVTVVESAKGGRDGPICRKKGSHKMEVLVH